MLQISYMNRMWWTIMDGSLDKKTIVTIGGNGGARIWLSACEYSLLRNPLSEGFNKPSSSSGFDFFRHITVIFGFIIDEGYILKPGFLHKHADTSSSNGFARRQVKCISFYVKKGEVRSRKCWRGLRIRPIIKHIPVWPLFTKQVLSKSFDNS